MTIYYVDSNSAQDDSDATWNSSTLSYLTDSAALAGSVSTDDIIWRAHNHAGSYAVTTTLTWPDGITVISVNSGTNAYEAGGTESTTTSADDIIFAGGDGRKFTFIGITETAADDFTFNSQSSRYDFIDCALTVANITTTGKIKTLADGVTFNMNGGSVTFASNANSYIQLGYGWVLNLDDVTLNFGATKPVYLMNSVGNGGIVANISNSDLTGVSASNPLFNNLTSDDSSHYTLSRCKLNASQVIMSVAPLCPGGKVDIYSCDNGDGYHYFEHIRHEGNSEEELTIYRTSGDTYDGSTNFSAELITNSNVYAFTRPLRVPLKSYQLDLTTETILTWYICLNDDGDTAIPATLTDEECWIELTRPDGTDNALGVVQTTRNANILNTPTNLATNSEAWTGDNATNKKLMEISITIPAITGMTNAALSAAICLAKDVTTDGDSFFIDPKPIIS